jgi:hypothetical protein
MMYCRDVAQALHDQDYDRIGLLLSDDPYVASDDDMPGGWD